MVEITRLSNGLTVVKEHMDHLRSVSFGVWIKVGSVNETVENNGISHVIEHMLFKGTKNRSAKQIADECAMLGGNLNAYTSKECTSFYVTTLDTHLNKAIEVLSDMITESLFDPVDLEKEKCVIIDEIDMYEDSPDDLVHELLQKEVWKDHSLGYIISGEADVVRGFTREQLLNFMKQYYHAENIVLSIAGNFDDEKTISLLEEKFGQVPKVPSSSKVTSPTYLRTFVTRDKDIEQIHMNLAFPCVGYNAKEKYILSIVNSILGGSENSKLFQVIREELGLAYSIYSYASTYNDTGLFHVDATLNPNNVLTVLKGIIQVITTFLEKGITQDELICAKEMMNTELIIGSESSRNRMNSNGKSMLCRNRIVSLDDTIRYIEQVTAEEVMAFAKEYLDIKNLSICLIGNLEEANECEIKEYWESLN